MSGAVLVARLDNCGDVLLAGPAVRAAAASGRPVHLLCGPRGRAAAELLPGVTGIIEMRAPWIEPDPMPVAERDAADDHLRAEVATDGVDSKVSALVHGGGPFVVVHPGSSAEARTLGPARWREVVTLAAGPRRVVLTGGPGEAGLTARVAQAHPDVVDLGSRLTLRQLGGVLASADALVTGNTGPMHLAAAVGTPVVAAFPPTVPLDRWRPWRVPHVAVGDQAVPCAGCRSVRCPLDDQPCLRAVDGEAMVAALAVLASAPGAEPAA